MFLSLTRHVGLPNLITLLIISISASSVCQNTIEVASGTAKISALSDELMYYGFAEGDEIIFNIQVLDGKDLKEFEISEYEGSSKFMEYKTKRVDQKSIKVNKTGIYVFRYSNSALSKRVCRFSIHRIAASYSTANFNTSVEWRQVYDTTYTPYEEKYLVKSDTSFQKIVDQKAKVSSQTAINGTPNRTIVDFELPPNTVKWSYYIGVGNEGQKAYDEAMTKFTASASKVALTIPGYGPLAALAISGVNYFSKTQGEDNVQFSFITNWDNALAFNAGNPYYQYKQGNVVNDATQMQKPLAGKIYLGLVNDNLMDAIEVYVTATAVVVTNEWGTRRMSKMNVTGERRAFLME
jgi:hypothetical protein